MIATAEEAVTGGVEAIVAQLIDVLVTLLPVVAPLVAILIGWRLARRIINLTAVSGNEWDDED